MKVGETEPLEERGDRLVVREVCKGVVRSVHSRLPTGLVVGSKRVDASMLDDRLDHRDGREGARSSECRQAADDLDPADLPLPALDDHGSSFSTGS